ncbi:MAG: AlpA family phage regulatory protein [Proteobacteria bacterium]|nr:AlpA family phage regulatory protein [Pseudomonadota bacterium]
MATPRTPETSASSIVLLGQLPAEGYVRQSQLIPAIVPFSPPTLWRKVKAGTFPKPVKLSPRITAWRVEDVRAWLANPNVSGGAA